MELKVSQLRKILKSIDDESENYRRGLQERIYHKGDLCFYHELPSRCFSVEEGEKGADIKLDIIRVTLNEHHEPVIKIG